MLPEKILCPGCGACAESCPQKCIIMEMDREGFRYPVINKDICVECGLCERCCPIANAQAVNPEPLAYAVQNRDPDIRLASSSGGVFSALAELVILDSGVVCAAKYNSDFAVIHDFCDSVDELGAFRGAKYAQSQTERCFPKIKQLLSEDRRVIFVGTPCQVAGLSAYLGRQYSNLILVDMICHGVPSPKVWKMYLLERRKTDSYDSVIQSVNLRSKESGWSHYAYCVEISYADGNHYVVRQEQDPYMRGFVQNLYLRPSCSQCVFKGTRRISDITLGDCWGIWDIDPGFDDNKGTSLLLIHTEKGKAVWNRIAARFILRQLLLDNAIAQNPSAICSSAAHPERAYFFERINDNACISETIQTCLTPKRTNLWQKIKRKLYQKG